MGNKKIDKKSIQFLKDVANNNNREWFAENKPRYQETWADLGGFVEEIVNGLSFYDEIEGGKAKIFRIYKDVRFSKDKLPYKSNFSAGMQREGKLRRGGYYFYIQPGDNSVIGGGFYNPEKEDLLRIRKAIAAEPERLRAIIAEPAFVNMYGELGGTKLKTAPRDFDKEHPAIDLIRHKSFTAVRKFTDKEILADTFLEEAVKSYVVLRPFFDYMTEVLTTNENGEVIV